MELNQAQNAKMLKQMMSSSDFENFLMKSKLKVANQFISVYSIISIKIILFTKFCLIPERSPPPLICFKRLIDCPILQIINVIVLKMANIMVRIPESANHHVPEASNRNGYERENIMSLKLTILMVMKQAILLILNLKNL